ncbi:MAG: hypothetical protein AB8B77_03130, partial [Alphaproteobacteria bacterium]
MPSCTALIQIGTNRLDAVGIDRSRHHARLILCHLAGCRIEDMIAFPERFDVDEQAFYRLIDRCAAGEPISRIRGTKEFYGRDFYISPAVLDPRPESETLIDVAKAEFSKDAALNILEIGVGSGALICTLLLEF